MLVALLVLPASAMGATTLGSALSSAPDGVTGRVGGTGNDTISAVDRARDTVDCGTAADTATVDKVDTVRHCEHVKRR